MYSQVIKELRSNLDSVIEALEKEFSNIRAGRANPSLVEKINIDYHGVATPIQQVASISVPEARLIVIQPWDTSIVGEIERSILKSDLGITPSNDGKVIRLPFPALTEERRKDLVKDIKSIADDHKVSVRNYRKEAMDKIKHLEKNESMPEDQAKQGESEVQDLVNEYNKKIDDILNVKEKELMEV